VPGLAGTGVTDLPSGVTARPLTRDDVDAVVAMVNECELADSGELMLERADLLSELALDGFDLGHDWVGVFEGTSPVGWALIETPRRASVDVHPDARGRGIGTWLRSWTEERARALGRSSVTQTIDDRRTEVVAMLEGSGYRPRHTSWILRVEHPERPDPGRVPDGVELRAFRERDQDEVLAMFETAFSEFEDREPSPPETWRAMVTGREGFEREDLVVAVADGGIVGGVFVIDADEIWVDKLAVARAYRHRGIARALLQTAFVRSFDRGYAWTSLSTDSRTSALSLYERVGMSIHRSFTNLALDL
jgi:GNAT superfamily N-acetyltransferase